ncbi:MAG: hypothetical protein WAO19_08380, partial [Candidatus Kryptoniota bacterium]
VCFLCGCTKHFSSTNAGITPPKTFVSAWPYADSIQYANFNPQSSSLELHWWADDGEGLVIGYITTFNKKVWTFTAKDDSIFFLPLFSKDTTYIFTVAAIDNSFKGKLNEGDTVAFTDKNGNGIWDKGEVFPLLGTSVDPDPPSIKFPIANTPPTVQFVMNEAPFVTRLDIPDTTFTVVSFGWQGTDVDGNNTIINYYIALNDTSTQSWVKLPAQADFVTLEARLSEASSDTSTVRCDVYPNTYPALSQSPLSTPLPNMKLNGNNIFYIKAEDVADAYSPAMRMPDTTHTWFVNKPKGNVLIINDYGVQDQSTNFYSSILDTIAGGSLHGKFDSWDIKTGSYYPRKGNLVQPYVIPTFQETLKLYQYIFWYSSDEQDFDIAQSAVRNFRNNGGKFFMTFTVPSSYSSGLDINQELSDFTGAIDSLTSSILTDTIPSSPVTSTGFVQPGATVQPVAPYDSTVYPNLIRDSYLSNSADGGKVVGNLRGIYPTLGASMIYNLRPYGADNRHPVMGVMSGDNSAFIVAVPLYRFNGNSTTSPNTRAYQLIYRVFHDFGAF